MALTKTYLNPALIKEFSSKATALDDILKALLNLEWVVEPTIQEALTVSTKVALSLNFSARSGFKQIILRAALDILHSGLAVIKKLEPKNNESLESDRLFHLDNACPDRVDFNENEHFYVEWTSNVTGHVFAIEEVILIPQYPEVPLPLQSSPLGLCLIAIAQAKGGKFIRGTPLDSPKWMDIPLKKERRGEYELFTFAELAEVVSKPVDRCPDCVEAFKQWLVHPGVASPPIGYQEWLNCIVLDGLHHLFVDFFTLPVDTEQALLIKGILWARSLDVRVTEIATCLAIAIHHQFNQFLSAYGCQLKVTR